MISIEISFLLEGENPLHTHSFLGYYEYVYYLEQGYDPNETMNNMNVMSHLITGFTNTQNERNILQLLHDFGGVVQTCCLCYGSLEKIKYVLSNFNLKDPENLCLNFAYSLNVKGIEYAIDNGYLQNYRFIYSKSQVEYGRDDLDNLQACKLEKCLEILENYKLRIERVFENPFLSKLVLDFI